MSTYGLSSETKRSVKATVLALRALLEGEFDPDTGDPVPPGGDVARQIARYGILINKPESFKSENTPEYLTDEEKKKRERISAAIKREVAIFGKLSDKAALKRGMRAFIRQTSYTWVNRLLGLRCMEARGLLKDDRGELDFVVTPSDDYGGLPRRAWRIKGEDPGRWQTAKLYDLQCEAIADACRQLTQEIKVLFDPEHDYGLIWPSAPTLNTLLQKIQELDKVATRNPFTSPDFLGWVYQYFQTIEKALVFEAASKKKKKIEKDDIIPATQIFTEHYMVEYLVQNSLGRLWMEMHADSKLSEKWAYYVKPPEENLPVERELKKAIEIKLMDPALGSAHFHLVSFDLLLDMYEEEIENAGKPGWPDIPSVEDKKDIPVAILEHNLFGIDIDARSIQLSSLVLVMKARESGYKGPINHLNLVVANSAPFESEAWYQFIQNLEKGGKHSVARVLAALGLHLKNLDEFGSLLRIEDEMLKIIQEEKRQWIALAKMGPEQDYLFPEMAKPRQGKLPFETAITDETFFDRLGSVIHKELDTFYIKARHDGLAEEAIMAADAERGFDFVRLSMQRYDAVYTNPPYMGSKNMGERLKKFVASAYPQGKRDLYAAFILRCKEMSKENGYMGMVTQQSWMFLRSFVNLRALPEEKLKKAKGSLTGLLRETTIETLAHLGEHAFDDPSAAGAFVALFTLRNFPPPSEHRMMTFRLIGPKVPQEKSILLRSCIDKTITEPINEIEQATIYRIYESPIVYWLKKGFLELMQSPKRLSSFLEAKQGLATADNDRFLRLFWEIQNPGSRWYKYAKGGGYGKWGGFEWYLVDWENDGSRVKKYINPATGKPYSNVWMLNKTIADYFFQAGLVYSMAARGSLSVRWFPSDGIFDQKAPLIVTNSEIPIKGIASLLNARLPSYLVRSITTTIDVSNEYIRNIPSPKCANSWDSLEQIGKVCIELKREYVSLDLTEHGFKPNLIVKFLGTDFLQSWRNYSAHIELLLANLHAIEGINERIVFNAYLLDEKEIQIVIDETGTPASWFPLIHGYDGIPENQYFNIPKVLFESINKIKHIQVSKEELKRINTRLHRLYETGLKGKVEGFVPEELHINGDNQKTDNLGGIRIPFPTETFLEKLSMRIQVHPISIYWLLKEMREEEDLISSSDLKRYTKDYVSIMILRMLGYQWPKQVEADETLPDWTDDDGIIPLTDGLGETTLLDRIRKRFGADFGEEKETSIESEFANIVGKPLEGWLEEDFFARHVKQFKKRPIAWHIVSDPSVVNHEAGQSGKGKKKGGKKRQKPAFSVMIHYHRFVDAEKGYGKLLLLKNKYLEKLMSQTQSELESLRGRGDDPGTFDRIAKFKRFQVRTSAIKW